MELLLTSCSDVGIKKKSNQDSFCVRIAETARGKAVMLVVCDGVGGLDGGEIASADVILAFAGWFENELPQHADHRIDLEYVRNSWDRLLRERNDRIVAYGDTMKARLGTTFVGLFMNEDLDLLIANVGDSRVYRLDAGIAAMTNDHTVAAQAVREGKLSESEARISKGRSVLLQCVGASAELAPEYSTEKAAADETWLLCSDGFRNRISEAEIFKMIGPGAQPNEQNLRARVEDLADACKRRGETDNITAIAMYIQR